MGNLMSEKKGIWDRTASKFRNTYHTVKKIRKRQSSKSYYIIPIILLFIYQNKGRIPLPLRQRDESL